MSSESASGWTKEADDLFIHTSGARIAKTTYQQKEGWFLMPADLDAPVLEFPPTEEGRAQAFETFAKGIPSRKKAKAKVKAKVDQDPESAHGREEDEEMPRAEGDDAAGDSSEANANREDDEEDADDDEDEEAQEESEGD